MICPNCGDDIRFKYNAIKECKNMDDATPYIVALTTCCDTIVQLSKETTIHIEVALDANIDDWGDSPNNI